MSNLESILSKSDSKMLNQFYKNMKTMVKVCRNKQDYSQNLTKIMTLMNRVEQNKQLDYVKLNSNFTMKDYKELFGDLRRTLMNGKNKQSKTNNLLKFSNKTNALQQYYLTFE